MIVVMDVRKKKLQPKSPSDKAFVLKRVGLIVGNQQDLLGMLAA